MSKILKALKAIAVVLAGILDETPAEKHKYLYHVEGSMSAIFFPEKINGKELKPVSIPNNYFKINVEVLELKK